MKPPRNDDYAERRKASEDAKKLLLKKFAAGQKAKLSGDSGSGAQGAEKTETDESDNAG